MGRYRDRCDELQELVKYEQEKNRAKLESHEGLLEELKVAKIQRRQYQEKADQVPDLQLKIESHELQIEQCIQQLRNSLVQSVVALEFNKDL